MIYERDGADKHAVRTYQMLEGEFLKRYTIQQQELSWTNELSENVYCFRNIDYENKVATVVYPTETPDIELLKDREEIEAVRWENNKRVRVDWKLFSRFESIESEVKGRYFKSLVRGGVERQAHDPEELLAEVEKEIPELDEGDKEENHCRISSTTPIPA